jgi:hypothetical protein
MNVHGTLGMVHRSSHRASSLRANENPKIRRTKKNPAKIRSNEANAPPVQQTRFVQHLPKVYFTSLTCSFVRSQQECHQTHQISANESARMRVPSGAPRRVPTRVPQRVPTRVPARVPLRAPTKVPSGAKMRAH